LIIYFASIIESSLTKKWYYGPAIDLERRLGGHNKGLHVSTRNSGPWKFVFIRTFELEKVARDLESDLKKSRNIEFIRRQFSEYFFLRSSG
jgi:predicted GIY-YIG superfamily endonuclease